MFYIFHLQYTVLLTACFPSGSILSSPGVHSTASGHPVSCRRRRQVTFAWLKWKKGKTMLLGNTILLLFSLHSGLHEGTRICATNICVWSWDCWWKVILKRQGAIKLAYLYKIERQDASAGPAHPYNRVLLPCLAVLGEASPVKPLPWLHHKAICLPPFNTPFILTLTSLSWFQLSAC